MLRKYIINFQPYVPPCHPLAEKTFLMDLRSCSDFVVVFNPPSSPPSYIQQEAEPSNERSLSDSNQES